MLYPIELLAHMDNCPDIVTQIRAAVNAASRQKVPSPSATRPFSFLQRVPRSSGRRGLGHRLVGDLHVLLLRPPEGYPGRSPGQPPTGGVHLIEPLRRGHAADQQQRQQTTGDELFPFLTIKRKKLPFSPGQDIIWGRKFGMTLESQSIRGAEIAEHTLKKHCHHRPR